MKESHREEVAHHTDPESCASRHQRRFSPCFRHFPSPYLVLKQASPKCQGFFKVLCPRRLVCRGEADNSRTYGKAVVHENAADDLRINSQVARREDSERSPRSSCTPTTGNGDAIATGTSLRCRNQQMYQSRACGMKHLVPPSSGNCGVVSGLQLREEDRFSGCSPKHVGT